MLDFIGTIVIVTVMVVILYAVVSSLPVSRSKRISAALAIGLWIGLAAASASAGMFAISRPFPYIGLFVVVPLIAIATLAAISPSWRTALLELPIPLLVGLNASRVFGAFFLLLAAAGRLSGPFPMAAGWGDIATGVLALPVLWLVSRPSRGGQWLVTGWNAFGALDLVVAIGLGIASAQNSPVQIFDVGPGSAALQTLPWAFIPTVLVPLYLVMHAIIFAKARQAVSPAGGDRMIAGAA